MKNQSSLWTIKRPFNRARLEPALKTLLFCGNGTLGVQALIPGSDAPAGTFINGFYETLPIIYGEKAYGYPSLQQVMIPLVDVLSWRIEEWFDKRWIPLKLTEGSIELDMQSGIRTLESEVELMSGNILFVQDETMTPFTQGHMVYNKITLKGSGHFRLIRSVSSPRSGGEESHDPRKMEALNTDIYKSSRFCKKDRLSLVEQTTKNSGLSYACAAGPFLLTDSLIQEESDSRLEIVREMTLENKVSQSWIMAASLYSSLEDDRPGERSIKELDAISNEYVKKSPDDSWNQWVKDQREYLDHFWIRGDINLEGSPEQTRALRYSTFGLIQSTGTDPLRSAAAKGLSSGGYNGHYFWDADIYVQGALSTLDSFRARNLTEYRISHLKEARQRAAELSEKGALYPWRTINGQECSAFFPAGTAQYHINADIVWGMKEFIDNSGEEDLLLDGGAEMVIEICRFWAAFAVKVPGKGYCLHCVTGPDEYTALVNNNFYTNLMVRECLKYGYMILEWMKSKYPDESENLITGINLKTEEPDLWKEISLNFYLPLDKETGVFKQDDAFMEKSPWDWASTPRENRPLLLHYHPLKIYRHKVMKQPDVIMGMMLQRQCFTEDSMAVNYDYYDPLTSGDSSLSSAVQATAAALAGKLAQAEEHFRRNLFLDLENMEKNTDNGVHLAAMAGARIALLFGFAGYMITDAGPSFSPCFPKSWGRVSFSVLYKGIQIRVRYDNEEKRVSFKANQPVEILYNGRSVRLETEHETELTG